VTCSGSASETTSPPSLRQPVKHAWLRCCGSPTSVSLGAEHLKRCGIAHQDIKAENIFYHKGVWMLGDLGSALRVDSSPMHTSHAGGHMDKGGRVCADAWGMHVSLVKTSFMTAGTKQAPYTGQAMLVLCEAC